MQIGERHNTYFRRTDFSPLEADSNANRPGAEILLLMSLLVSDCPQTNYRSPEKVRPRSGQEAGLGHGAQRNPGTDILLFLDGRQLDDMPGNQQMKTCL
jgi:hypothetical protein